MQWIITGWVYWPKTNFNVKICLLSFSQMSCPVKYSHKADFFIAFLRMTGESSWKNGLDILKLSLSPNEDPSQKKLLWKAEFNYLYLVTFHTLLKYSNACFIRTDLTKIKMGCSWRGFSSGMELHRGLEQGPVHSSTHHWRWRNTGPWSHCPGRGRCEPVHSENQKTQRSWWSKNLFWQESDFFVSLSSHQGCSKLNQKKLFFHHTKVKSNELL